MGSHNIMFLKLFYLAFSLTIGQSLGQDIKSSVPEDQEVSRSPRYWTGRNILDVVVVRTANGSGCGMGVLGFISVLICRNDGECCQTGELHTFTEGKEKKFTSDNLQSCFGFDLQDPVDPITLKVQHAGRILSFGNKNGPFSLSIALTCK